MIQIATVLLPIFAVVGLGAALRRVRFVPAAFFSDVNRLVYWIAIPALLFYKSADARLEGDAALRVIAAILGGLAISLAAGYLLAAVMRLGRTSTAAFAQGAFRGNLAYVGLPVVLLALASQNARTPANEAIAVLALAAVIPVYNFVAVFVLVGGQEAGRRQIGQRVRELLLRIATNPLLIACLAGLLVMAAGWKLSPPIRETCRLVGDMATPLALLSIGASLTFESLRAYWTRAGVASAVKLIISPLAGLALAVPLQLTGA